MEFFYKISFDGFESPLRLILTSIFVFLYIIFSYRGVRPLKGSKRVIISVMRTIIIIFVILISGEVSIKRLIYAKEKTDVAVLIDTSKSMSMKSGEPAITRLDAVKKFLKDNHELIDNIKNNHNLAFYSFDRDAKKISEGEIDALRPSGDGTDIGKAVDMVLQKSGSLSAVLLFSDGVDTEGFERILADFKFPASIFAFSPGSGAERDIGLKNLSSSGFALNREKYELSFEITMKGWKEIEVPVTLKGENSVIKTERVNLKDGETKGVRMEFTPLRVGKQLFTIEIPVFTGDDYPQNNRISFILNVLRDRLRLLLLSGKPHWDLRFLRQILKTSPWVDLVNFNILRTPFDLVNIPEIELSLIPFPADEIFREGLDSFDVFIMQNFDPAQFVPPSYLRNVSDFVKKGGGLAVIGGTLSSRANFYLSSEMGEAVPLQALSSDLSGRYHLRPSPDAMNHPLNRFFKKYKRLPPIDFVNAVEGVKSWATVLAETEEGHLPVIVAGNFGKGKVLAVLTNSLWQLAFSPEGRGTTSDAYVDFWLSALRWLSGEPDESNVLIESAKDTFDSGEEVRLNVRVLNKKYMPIRDNPLSIKVLNVEDGEIAYRKEWKGKGPEEVVEFSIDKEGAYNVTMEVHEGDKVIDRAESKLIVKSRRGEMESPFTNDELLKELAQRTGGKFFKLTERVKDIDIKSKNRILTGTEKKRPLWNSPYIYLTTIILFSLEWHLRRRWGLR